MKETYSIKQRSNPLRLSGNQLKLIAIICMVIDHVAFLFIKETTPIHFAMRTMGRITFPIMAFFIAEGYQKTSNIKQYLLRLGIFAIISIFPFYFAFQSWRNIYITLFFGLLSLYLTEKTEDKHLRFIIVMLCALASYFGDYSVVGVPLIYLFGRIKDSKKRIWLPVLIFVLLYVTNFILNYFVQNQFAMSNFTIIGAFLSIPLLSLYSGKRGLHSPGTKNVFYWFYPLHLIILKGIYILINL